MSRRHSARGVVRLIGLYAASALVLLFFLTPVWWILMTSVKDPLDYAAWPGSWYRRGSRPTAGSALSANGKRAGT